MREAPYPPRAHQIASTASSANMAFTSAARASSEPAKYPWRSKRCAPTRTRKPSDSSISMAKRMCSGSFGADDGATSPTVWPGDNRRGRSKGTSAAALAGDELGERRLRLGAADDLRRVLPLVRPLRLEISAQVLQQNGLHAHHRLAPVLGDHRRQPHGLLPQLVAWHQVVEQADAVRFGRLDGTPREQELLGD